MMQEIKVLLIEDESAQAWLAERTLAHSTRIAFAVSHARSLAEAFEILGQQAFDVAVVDLGLRNGEGIGTLSRIKAAHPGLMLVVHTGHEEGLEFTEMLLRHADAVLYKQLVARQFNLLADAIELVWLRRENAGLRASVESLRATPRRRRLKWINTAASACARFVRELMR